MYYLKNNSNSIKRKLNEITIACFINSLCRFTKMLHKTQKKFSLRRAIFHATLRFFCKALFVSRFGPW